MKAFKTWLVSVYEDIRSGEDDHYELPLDSPVEDLANDIGTDRDFPLVRDAVTMYDYLVEEGASDNCIEAFWRAYRAYVESTNEDRLYAAYKTTYRKKKGGIHA